MQKKIFTIAILFFIYPISCIHEYGESDIMIYYVNYIDDELYENDVLEVWIDQNKVIDTVFGGIRISGNFHKKKLLINDKVNDHILKAYIKGRDILVIDTFEIKQGDKIFIKYKLPYPDPLAHPAIIESLESSIREGDTTFIKTLEEIKLKIKNRKPYLEVEIR